MMRSSGRNKPFAAKNSNGGHEVQQQHSAIVKKMIASSRQSGKLNLSSQRLSILPEELFQVPGGSEGSTRDYSFETSSSNSWWECVDLQRLLLADNELTSLDERIMEFGALVLLDCHGNMIQSLPTSLANLNNLQIVNFSHNKLQHFPRELCYLPLLSDLNLTANEIEDLPSNFGSLTNLVKLDLSCNRLKLLPNSMATLTLLQHLDLSENKLERLWEGGLNSLEVLITLHLEKNNLTRLSDGPVCLDLLSSLNCSYNDFRVLETVMDCPKLIDICFSFNSISSVSQGTFRLCPSIEIFDIRDNNISEVFPDILEMSELKRLDISNNSISILPPALCKLKNMAVLHWVGNPLRGLPTSGGTTKLMEHLEKKLVHLPSSEPSQMAQRPRQQDSGNRNSKILDYSNLGLQSLDLSSLEDFPEILNASHNLLKELPSNFHDFSHRLTTIDFSKNKFTCFPDLANCPSLITIDLSSNHISSYPSSGFPLLPRLNELNLNNNRITTWPSSLPLNISILLLSSNNVTSIEMPLLNELTQLNTLDLSNNSINHVPPELGLLNLNNLVLVGNLFKVPRAQIIAKGTAEILSYLRDRIVH